MTLLLMDGFGGYGASADLDLRWTRAGTCTYGAATGVGGVGGVALGTSSSLTGPAFVSTLTSGGTMHAAFWMKVTDMPGGFLRFFQFWENAGGGDSNSPQVQVSNLGAIRVTACNSAATILATSADGVIVLNQEHHIEMSGRYSNTGEVKVWVDGDLIINFSGDSTFGTTPTSFIGFSFHTGSSFAMTISHPVVWDEVGADFVVTQLAEHFIEQLLTAADDSVQFTPLSSTNESNIDDVGFHDGDTSYNQSPTVGHIDLFTLADQVATPTTMFAVAVHTVARKTDVGGVTLRNRISLNGNVTEGSDKALATTYARYSDYFGKSPDGGGAWGNTDVNSLKAGYEYQA